MTSWYWKDGTPAVTARVDTPEWHAQMAAVTAKHQDMEYKRVAFSELPDGRYVSTVWLGLDHGHGAGPPIIFESMLFPACKDCDRYRTEAEALEGHEAMVARHSTKH